MKYVKTQDLTAQFFPRHCLQPICLYQGSYRFGMSYQMSAIEHDIVIVKFRDQNLLFNTWPATLRVYDTNSQIHGPNLECNSPHRLRPGDNRNSAQVQSIGLLANSLLITSRVCKFLILSVQICTGDSLGLILNPRNQFSP
jgi:hypothetical protein